MVISQPIRHSLIEWSQHFRLSCHEVEGWWWSARCLACERTPIKMQFEHLRAGNTDNMFLTRCWNIFQPCYLQHNFPIGGDRTTEAKIWCLRLESQLKCRGPQNNPRASDPNKLQHWRHLFRRVMQHCSHLQKCFVDYVTSPPTFQLHEGE